MRTQIAIIALPLCLLGSAAAAAELDVLAAAELGDELGVRPHALDLDHEGNVVIAGEGTLVRIDAAGDPTGPLSRLGDRIDDVAIDRSTGNVVVVTAGELRLLGPDLEVQWERALEASAAPHRLGVGEQGTIAVTSGAGLEIVSASGEPRGRIAGDDRIAAVAVLDRDELVVTTGSSSTCSVDWVSLAAFTTTGQPRWRGFAAELGCDGGAATRGVDVARGEDGMIYLLAEVEAGRDAFLGAPATSFDDATTRDRIDSPLFAYYARFTPAGVHAGGQYLGFADALSVVEPGAIAADRHGNVHLTGVTTHSIAEPDEVPGEAEIVDLLDTPSAFYQVVAADFSRRQAWKQLELDERATEIDALALSGDLVLTLVHPATSSASRTLVAWPTAQGRPGRRPDRDDIGTFGYESGVAGADPTCYCDASRPTSTPHWLALGSMFLLGLRRRRA